MSGTLVPPTAPRPHDDDCDCLTCTRQAKAEANRQALLKELTKKSREERRKK